MVFIGPYISQYNEADILDESLFIVPGGDEYPDTDTSLPARLPIWERITWEETHFRGFFMGHVPPSVFHLPQPYWPTFLELL